MGAAPIPALTAITDERRSELAMELERQGWVKFSNKSLYYH